MTFYIRCVSLVAVSDLFLVGLFYWLLTRMYRYDEASPPREHFAASGLSHSESSPSDSSLAVESDLVEASDSDADSQAVPLQSHRVDAAEIAMAPARFSAGTSWTDFDRQLQSIQSWIRAARVERDEQLSDEAMAYLRHCAQSWCSAVGACVETGGDHERQGLMDGTAEAVLAQLETTLTNLSSAAASGSLDEKLDRLDRELKSLQRSRVTA